MRIAYFTNQYPAVSHTFIRREIAALEQLGVIITRYAIRSAPTNLVDVADQIEEKKTRHIFEAGAAEILRCFTVALLKQPLLLASVFWLACKVGWRTDRGVLRHLAYVVEATVLAEWCRRDAVQHLHAHFGTNSAAVAMFASQLSGLPYSFTAHGPDEFDRASQLSLGEKLKRATFAICVSSFGKSQLMRWSSLDQWPKIEVVHCGVDSSFLEGPVQPPSTAARFVCVGRFVEAKAQLVLIQAIRELQKTGTHCQLVLVGDGPMRIDIENAIREARLEKQITLTGWASGERVKSEILSSRAMVLASFSENMPVVIMEAMALGRAVISTYIAGIPELIQPRQTGWLVPASDEKALAEAMRESLAASSEELATMGAAARHHIINCHDSLKEAAKLKALFTKSIGYK